MFSTPKKDKISITPDKQQNQKSSKSVSPIYSDRYIPMRNNNFINQYNLQPWDSDQLQNQEQKSQNYQFLLHQNLVKEACEIQKDQQNIDKMQQYKAQCLHQLNSDERKLKYKIDLQLSPYEQKYLKNDWKDSLCQNLAHLKDDIKNDDNRHISQKPYKILEAPGLKDDFYLQVLDWSGDNIIGVCLGKHIYNLIIDQNRVEQINVQNENPSSLKFQPEKRNCLLALGTQEGKIQIWDVNKQKKLHDFYNSQNQLRIGVMDWRNSNLITTGSKDFSIFTRDLRCPMKTEKYVHKFVAHNQEVCGLKWSEQDQLASGGNDNKVFIWSDRKPDKPQHKFVKHVAAVKGLAWSHIHKNILLSGGGNSDQYIHVWNTLSMQNVNSIFTGSQISNIIFSKTVEEFVTSMGSCQDNLIVWKYPNLEKAQIIDSHSSRVLYMSQSPDGDKIVTGAGDETLKFWNIFPQQKLTSSIQNLLYSTMVIR